MPAINSTFDESAFADFLESNSVQLKGMNLPALYQISAQFAAETEAVVMLTDNYGDEEFHARIPGISMREEIINLGHDIRMFGCRERVNGGLIYEAF